MESNFQIYKNYAIEYEGSEFSRTYDQNGSGCERQNFGVGKALIKTPVFWKRG
jgi:hypothetical protein